MPLLVSFRQVLYRLNQRPVLAEVFHSELAGFFKALLRPAQLLIRGAGDLLPRLLGVGPAHVPALPDTSELIRPFPQRQQVCGTQPPPCPGQQTHQRIRPVRVCQHAKHRHHINHLGAFQKPAQANHLCGHPQCLTRLPDRFHLAAGAGQHRHGGHIRGVIPEPGAFSGYFLGNTARLISVGGVPGQLHRTAHRRLTRLIGAGNDRTRPQIRYLRRLRRPHPPRHSFKGLSNEVRGIQNRRIVTPRNGQIQGRLIGGGEIPVKTEQLTVRCAAEPIN